MSCVYSEASFGSISISDRIHPERRTPLVEAVEQFQLLSLGQLVACSPTVPDAASAARRKTNQTRHLPVAAPPPIPMSARRFAARGDTIGQISRDAPPTGTVECVSNGFLGNGLDAAIACMVYGRAVGAMTWILFDGLPDIVGGVYPWKMMGWQFDAGGNAHFQRDATPPASFRYPQRYHRCMTFNGADNFLRRCTRDAIRKSPGLDMSRCDGYQNESSGVWQLRRDPSARIEACFAWAPADMGHDEWITSYRQMGAALHAVWRERVPEAARAGPTCDLGVHLRLGIRVDQRKDASREEERFHVSSGAMGAAVLSLPSSLPIVVAIDDKSRLSEALSGSPWLQHAVVLQNMSALAEHFVLQTCRRVLTYAYSSFSWTAAAMAPDCTHYFLATNHSGEKAAWYVGETNQGFVQVMASAGHDRRKVRAKERERAAGRAQGTGGSAISNEMAATPLTRSGQSVRLPRSPPAALRSGLSGTAPAIPLENKAAPPCPAETTRRADRSAPAAAATGSQSLRPCDGSAVGTSGRWLPRSAHFCGLRSHYGSMGAGEGPSGRCSATTQPWAELCWKPDSCHIEPFSPAAFCGLVAKHDLRILVVGDSISYLFYQAILHQLDPSARIDDARGPGGQWQVVPPHATAMVWDPTSDTGSAFSICGGRGSLLFRRNDQLTLDARDTFPEQYDWARFVAGADVVILNKGAHVVSPEQYERELRETKRFLRRAASEALPRKKLFLFRSTPSGHPDCSLQTLPVLDSSTSLMQPRRFGKTLASSSMYNPRWKWDEFASRDALAREMVESLPGGTFVNVTAMTMLRPDGHIGCTRSGSGCDCLHYFVPGPVDAWVQAVSHVVGGLLPK